jgi:uronate dehydrogenase
MRVLITGASGLLGSILRSGLGDAHALVCLDARRHRETLRVDSRDLDRLERHAAGADAIVDLGANADNKASWADVSANNIPAAATVLEAARLRSVPRVVFASSNRVTGLYERDAPYASIVAGEYDGLRPGSVPLIGPDWPLRPDGPYAVSKALAEAMCCLYSGSFGVSTVCLRIGSVTRTGRPAGPRDFATFLSHGDLVRLVRCALSVPDLEHGVYYGVSANAWRFWDIANAEAELGYRPQDDAERFRARHDRAPESS